MYLTNLDPNEPYLVHFRPRNAAENRAKIRFLKFSGWGINKQDWPEYSPLDLTNSNLMHTKDLETLRKLKEIHGKSRKGKFISLENQGSMRDSLAT